MHQIVLLCNQLLPTKLFRTKGAMKTAQALKITSASSLLILEDRKLFIEAKLIMKHNVSVI